MDSGDPMGGQLAWVPDSCSCLPFPPEPNKKDKTKQNSRKLFYSGKLAEISCIAQGRNSGRYKKWTTLVDSRSPGGHI